MTSLRAHRESPTGTQPAVEPTAGCAFRREGEYRTIVYDGIVTRLRDAKGMHFLTHLLAHPGEHVAAAQLIAATGLRTQ